MNSCLITIFSINWEFTCISVVILQQKKPFIIISNPLNNLMKRKTNTTAFHIHTHTTQFSTKFDSICPSQQQQQKVHILQNCRMKEEKLIIRMSCDHESKTDIFYSIKINNFPVVSINSINEIQ